MQQPLENGSRQPVPARAASDLRIVRPDNPCLAPGSPVSHLMAKPAFGRSGPSSRDSSDCIIFNVLASSSTQAKRLPMIEGRKAMAGKQAACSRRHDPDGSTRASRLAVNEFVDRHIERGG